MTQALNIDENFVPGNQPRPIRILHIFPSFELGGQQARFAAIANGLGSQFDHRVIALDGETTASELLCEAAPVSFTAIEMKKSRLVSLPNIRLLKTAIENAKPDALCTYNWGAIEACMANKLFCRVPHIHFEDGFGDDETPVRQVRRRVLTRNIILRGSTIVTPSRELSNIAVTKWGLNKASVIKISNGVEYERFQLSPNIRQGDVIIGAVGALRPEKRFDRLIAALKTADLKAQAKLVIVGEGPDRARLRSVTENLGMHKRVTFAGACAAPETYYRDFDIFALSSQTEQAPLTILEAMASGLPIISTDVGDIASMVCSSNDAFITELGNEEGYCEALSHLIQNANVRAELGAANRKKARAEYSMPAMVNRYRALFQSLVHKNV